MMHKEFELFQVGIIVKTHGLKGEVKVKSTTDFPCRFKIGSELLLESDSTVEVLKSREQKGFWFLIFKDFEDINKVERFVGQKLYVSKRDDQLAPNEFYVSDLLGLPVFSTDQQSVGSLKDVLHYGPNDVWVIKKTKGKELLLPYTSDFIKKVDLENNQIIVDLSLVPDEN